jgi:hypothetical protein
MSTTEALKPMLAATPVDEFDYRPLGSGAIAAVVFGLMSLLIFVVGRDNLDAALMLSPIALVGIVVGARALRQIRANPGEFSGGKAALAGLTLSAVSLVGGLAFSGYVYATEVPDGYARRSFADLKPSETDERADRLIPTDVAELDGKKVFIKGYIRPDSTQYRQNIGEFLLVRDNNQCCFGDISTVKYYDQIAVTMQGKLRVDYHGGLYRIGGTLRVNPQNARPMSPAPAYYLEADYAE